MYAYVRVHQDAARTVHALDLHVLSKDASMFNLRVFRFSLVHSNIHTIVRVHLQRVDLERWSDQVKCTGIAVVHINSSDL